MTQKLAVPKKPQAISELFHTAYLISKKTFFETLPFLIFLILSSFALQYVGKLADYYNKTNQYGISFFILLLFFVILFFNYASMGGIIYRMHSIVKRKDPGFTDSLIYGSTKVLPLVAVSILYTLAVLFGLILLIVPGIMLSVYFIFAFYLLFFDLGIIDSFKESFNLVKNHWWRVLFTLILFLIALLVLGVILLGILFMVSFAIDIVFGNLIVLSEHWAFLLFLQFISSIFIVFVYCYSFAFMLTLIYDLQNRKGRDRTQ